jgi:APA family basic amino acid/polyamine antiporter
VLFALVAVWFVDTAHFVPFNPSGERMPMAINATVALALWAMLGLEAATIPAESVEDAKRVVPRATVIGTLLAGVATVLAVTTVLGLLPAEQLKESQAPMADAARALWGPWAGIGIALVMAISCLGALNGWVLVSGHIPLAAARDGLMPKPFARVDKDGTPTFGVIVSSVLASLLVAANFSRSLVQLFTFMILVTTAVALLPYLVGSAAWLLRGERRGRIVALFALIYSGYALLGTGSEALLWGAVLAGAGLPIYAWMRWTNSR